MTFDLEPGKTLVITLRGLSDVDAEGKRTVFFDLNGYPRAITIKDDSKVGPSNSRVKADTFNPNDIQASMPVEFCR